MTEHLTWIQALVLGISQGLTEFLPVSSSAHTLILSRLLGWQDPGAAFTAVTQIGTEAAVIWYFRVEIRKILVGWFNGLFNAHDRKGEHSKMGWAITIGTLPIGLFGVLFQRQIETTARNLWIVASALIVMGVILGIADKRCAQIRTESDITMMRAVVFGIGQALALIPGVSRSGATITFGRLMGFTRESAARYSFLLAIPAVIASALFEATKIGDDDFVNWPATIVATLIAGIVGYLVIARLMQYLRTESFAPFVAYRIVLGTLVLVLVATGVLSAV